jgi:hypothetical protein
VPPCQTWKVGMHLMPALLRCSIARVHIQFIKLELGPGICLSGSRVEYGPNVSARTAPFSSEIDDGKPLRCILRTLGAFNSLGLRCLLVSTSTAAMRCYPNSHPLID